MSREAVGFADLRSRRDFMSLDGAHVNARHQHCWRSGICSYMHPYQRRYNCYDCYDERVTSLRSMFDCEKDIVRSYLRPMSTTPSRYVRVSPRKSRSITDLRVIARRRRIFYDFPLSHGPMSLTLVWLCCGNLIFFLFLLRQLFIARKVAVFAFEHSSTYIFN